MTKKQKFSLGVLLLGIFLFPQVSSACVPFVPANITNLQVSFISGSTYYSFGNCHYYQVLPYISADSVYYYGTPVTSPTICDETFDETSRDLNLTFDIPSQNFISDWSGFYIIPYNTDTTPSWNGDFMFNIGYTNSFTDSGQFNETPTTTPLVSDNICLVAEAKIGDVVFGIGILVALASFALIGMVFNSIFKKRSI